MSISYCLFLRLIMLSVVFKKTIRNSGYSCCQRLCHYRDVTKDDLMSYTGVLSHKTTITDGS